MIDHDREGQAINAEDGREKLQSVAYRVTSMFAANTAAGIAPSEKCPPNATMNNVKDLDLRRIDDFTPSLPSYEPAFPCEFAPSRNECDETAMLAFQNRTSIYLLTPDYETWPVPHSARPRSQSASNLHHGEVSLVICGPSSWKRSTHESQIAYWIVA